MSTPRVSVVIPCRNEATRIAAVLDALRTQAYPLAEVIVAHGRSTDGTQAALQAYGAAYPSFPLRVVANPASTIPAGLNLAIGLSTGEIIVRLDAHSRPHAEYVRRSVETLLATGAGNVGGRWQVRPGAETPIAQAIALAAQHPLGAGDAAYRLAAPDSPARAVETVPFGCFRKSLWEQLGGFDETLLTNEDYDFNDRVRQAGGVVWLNPAIQAEYFARPTLRTLATQYYRYGWWKAQMIRKRPSSLRWRQLLPPLMVAGGLGLTLLAPWHWALTLAWLLYMAEYAGIIGLVSWRTPNANRYFAVALFIIHWCWGGGVLANFAGRPVPSS